VVGDVILEVDGINCSVDISQPKDGVPHTPTREEIEREKACVLLAVPKV
jgi:hypothetical protein